VNKRSLRGRWDLHDGVLSPFKAGIVRKYAGDSVLDVGCNTGQLVSYLASLGKRVVGVDVDPNLITAAKWEHPTLSFCLASAENLPFKDNLFDTCVCWNVLEHVEDDKLALKELWRVARKNVILCLPKKDNLLPFGQITYRQYVDPTHKHYYSKEHLYRLFEELPDKKRVKLEEITRISPLVTYANIGYPMFILRLIDEFLYRFSPSKKRDSFYSDILVIAEKREVKYD